MADSRHLDAYKAFLDPGLSPDEKKARIDSIYAAPDPTATELAGDPGATAMAAPDAGPDLRLAQGGQPRTDGQPFNAAASVPDVQPAMIQHGKAGPPTPNPAFVPPGQIAVPAQPMGFNPPAPALPPSAAVAPVGAVVPVGPEPSISDMAGADERSMLMQRIGSGGSGVIAAHDQPINTVHEYGGAVSPETKEALASSQEAEQGLTLQSGEQAAQAHEAQAAEAAHQHVEAIAQREEFKQRQAQEQEHLAGLNEDYQKTLKDSELQPNAWFTNKSTGGKITSIIGAMMLGLGGHPEMVDKIIDDDMAQRNANRDKMLAGKREGITDFRQKMLNPEARMAMERAMYNDIVAAQARRLAESAAAPEARMTAMQLSQQRATLSAQDRAKAEQMEGGTYRDNIAHVARQVVGGGDVTSKLKKWAADTGHTFDDAVKLYHSGKLPAAATGDLKDLVITPGGEKFIAPNGDASKITDQFRASSELQNNYAEMREIIQKGGTGRTLSPVENAKLRALSANVLTNLKKAQGDGVPMRGEMLDKLETLSGGKSTDTFSLDAATLAGIGEAARASTDRTETLKRTLIKPNPDAVAGIQTGGSSAAAVGFTPSGGATPPPLARPTEPADRGMPKAGFMPGQPMLDPSIAPVVPHGAARPLAPGEFVRNPDGSWSSEVSMTVQSPDFAGGKAVVIPSMWIKNGKPYIARDEDEAIEMAKASKLPFKTYVSIKEADKSAEARESEWQPIENPKDARKIAPLWAK